MTITTANTIHHKMTIDVPAYGASLCSECVVGWWSGGVTSAVTCKLIVGMYGLDRCRFIMQDTFNEHPDTYRFKQDCEAWYGKEIETITQIGVPIVNKKTGDSVTYNSIDDIWDRYLSLGSGKGAICSSILKRDLRLRWQRENAYAAQAFGFDIKESLRALSMANEHPKAKPIFPLLNFGLSKKDCVRIIENAGIEIPKTYQPPEQFADEIPLEFRCGLQNNNCWQTGCIHGKIWYWQWMFWNRREVFESMANREHRLTELKGKPVTINKDQSAEAKRVAKSVPGSERVFLKLHAEYPSHKTVFDFKGVKPEPLMECNGFCGTHELVQLPQINGNGMLF